MTHNHPQVLASARFFALVTASVLAGSGPVEAMEKAAGETYDDVSVGQWVEQGLASTNGDTRKIIIDFGQMCETEAAFPATVHLIAKYEDNLKEALIENVMAGGDSSSRGMLAGMVLAARLGPAAIPADWLSDLRARTHIEALLSKIS
jgi:ADP-ribosylglycohydrolase